MRFHFLGVGPIGSLVSHHLRRAIPPAHSIVLLHGSPFDALKAPNSFHVEAGGSYTTSENFWSETFDGPVVRARNGQPITQPGDTIDSLFVTTRAPATLHALRKLAPRLSENSTIVLLQNGLGVYDELVRNLFVNPSLRPHFIFASSSHAGFFPEKTKLLHSTMGEIEFGIVPDPLGRNFEAGFLDETLHPSERRPHLTDIAKPSDPTFLHYRSLRNTVAALLLAEPLNARWKSVAHVQLALRRKLVVHSVIQPLSAIMGCRTGDLFSASTGVRIASAMCQEASDVYAAQILEETKAYMATAESDLGGALGVARLPNALQQRSLVRECLHVAEASGDTFTTMLGAIRSGRSTEIDYLNGYLLRLGKAYNVDMPTHTTLYDLVRMRSEVPLD
ncbi:ketopantoate reductase-like protein [Mycena rebaudengoi]|nr:ketopantoate reductase-like protein [Mycena rebaudengoi]